MIKAESLSVLRGFSVALFGAATLVTFTSCTDETEEAAAAEQGEPAAAAPSSELAAAKEALFNDMLFEVGPKLTSSMTDQIFTIGIPSPECWDKVCVYLEKLENYYNALEKGGSPEELARVAIRIAQLRTDLASPKYANEWYVKAKKHFDAMSAADKASAKGKALNSEIEEGIGSTMQLNEAEQAVAHLESAIALRKELVFALVPEAEIGNQTSMPPELSEHVVALMRDTQRLAICYNQMSEIGKAREVLRSCSTLVGGFPVVACTQRARVQFAHLNHFLGNLEYKAGDTEAALNAWLLAAAQCSRVASVAAQDSGSVLAAGYTAEAKAIYQELEKLVKRVREDVDEAEKTASESAEEPAAEPAAE